MKTPTKGTKAAEMAPKHLRPETRAWFERTVADFILEEHHRRLLQLAAEAWDRGLQAREAIATHGLTFTDRFGGVRVRPEVQIERDSRIGFARLLRELALDVEEPGESRPPWIRGKAGLRVAQ